MKLVSCAPHGSALSGGQGGLLHFRDNDATVNYLEW
jgi:hypothetical protein